MILFYSDGDPVVVSGSNLHYRGSDISLKWCVQLEEMLERDISERTVSYGNVMVTPKIAVNKKLDVTEAQLHKICSFAKSNNLI